MCHGSKERAAAVGGGEICHPFFAAVIEVGVGDIGARGHGSFDDIESRLEDGIFDCRGHEELGGFAFFSDLKHEELVGVEGNGALSSWESDTDEIFARDLVGFDEFAFCPVAHHLHTGVSLDDERGGEVPVASGEVVIDISAQDFHTIEGLAHFCAAKGGGVEIDHGGFVEVVSEREDNSIEDGCVLPCLPAVGEGDDSVVAHFVEDGDEFLP